MNNEKETFWHKHGTKVKITCAFVAGGIVMYIVGSNSDNITGGIKSGIQIAFGGDVTNTVTTDLTRRGHPGYIVKHVASGVPLASKRQMMDYLGVSHSVLERMIDEGEVLNLGLAQ